MILPKGKKQQQEEAAKLADARKRFLADLHLRRQLQQLKGTQRLLKADEEREAAEKARMEEDEERVANLEKDRKAKEDEADKYRDTVLLPSTSFPQRASAKTKEPELQKFWAETGVYEDLWRKASGEAFTLHDGPPYANGDLHIGHALNKVLKDFINRYKTLTGRKVRYVPGWDCHGLPIELKVLQAIGAENKKIKKIGRASCRERV